MKHNFFYHVVGWVKVVTTPDITKHLKNLTRYGRFRKHGQPEQLADTVNQTCVQMTHLRPVRPRTPLNP